MTDDDRTTQRRSTAVPHSGAAPSIPSLEPNAGATPRPPFNDPLPPATTEAEAESPSRRPADLEDVRAPETR